MKRNLRHLRMLLKEKGMMMRTWMLLLAGVGTFTLMAAGTLPERSGSGVFSSALTV